MFHLPLTRRRALVGLAGTLTTIVGGGASPSASTARAEATTGRLGTVEYGFSKGQEGAIEAILLYPHETKAQLQDYVSTNRNLLTQLAAGPSARLITAQVVLSHPVPPSEMLSLAAAYNLNIRDYILRAVTSDGQRITIFGAPEGSEIVPSAMLNRATTSIQQHNPTARLLGIVTVDGTLSVINAVRLAGDANVALVDVTAEVVRRRAQAQFGTGVRVNVRNPVQIYWFFENAGIVHD